MKQILSVLAVAAALVACQNTPAGDTATTANAEQAASATGTTYSIDTTATTIGWVGAKPTGEHSGTFNVTDGSLSVDANGLTGGSFVINIDGMQVTDLQGEDKAKLEGHLKSADFFDATSFPTAKFVITAVAPYDSTLATTKLEGATHLISGNLTLKDSTVNITFPAKVQVAEGAVMAQADFNIDRTQWGMNYKGPNNPADWMIKKEVELKLDIKAAGQSL